MPSTHPAWLKELVNDTDVDPKSLLAVTALEIALSPRSPRPTARRSKRSRTDPSRLPPFDKDLQCKHCGKAFRRVCNYREHQRVHSNEYKFQCTVQGCDRKFMWRSSIQAHLRSHQAKLDRKRRSTAASQRSQTRTIAKPHLNIPKLSVTPPLSPVSPMPPGYTYMPPPLGYGSRYVAMQHSR